jgi:hypothetical protein
VTIPNSLTLYIGLVTPMGPFVPFFNLAILFRETQMSTRRIYKIVSDNIIFNSDFFLLFFFVKTGVLNSGPHSHQKRNKINRFLAAMVKGKRQ